jgi:hypothetical protein
MNRHREFEDLAIAGMDFRLSAAEESTLERHLHTCPDCWRTIGRYREDASSLRSIAITPAPPRVSAAIFAPRRPPADAGVRWSLIGAVIIVLLLLAATAVVGALVQRESRRWAIPLGALDWAADGDASRIVGAAPVNDGWLVGFVDESLAATNMRIYRPGVGWVRDALFDQLATDAGSPIQFGGASHDLVLAAYSSNHGVLLTRDRAGLWQTHEFLETVLIRDVAVRGDDVWVLGEPKDTSTRTQPTFIVLSSSDGSIPHAVDIPVRSQAARLAATRNGLAIAGCSSRGEAPCELEIYLASRDWTWSRAALPATVDLGDYRKATLDTAGSHGPTNLPPQLIGLDSDFVTIAPGEGGDTEIWFSNGDRPWEVATTFPSSRHPVGLATDGSRLIGIAVLEGRLWTWTQDVEGWRGAPVDIEAESYIGLAIHGDRALVLGIVQAEVQAWEISP